MASSCRVYYLPFIVRLPPPSPPSLSEKGENQRSIYWFNWYWIMAGNSSVDNQLPPVCYVTLSSTVCSPNWLMARFVPDELNCNIILASNICRSACLRLLQTHDAHTIYPTLTTKEAPLLWGPSRSTRPISKEYGKLTSHIGCISGTWDEHKETLQWDVCHDWLW